MHEDDHYLGIVRTQDEDVLRLVEATAYDVVVQFHEIVDEDLFHVRQYTSVQVDHVRFLVAVL